MGVLGFDGLTGLTGRVGKAIAGIHEVALRGLIENCDLSKPFAGGGAYPAGRDGARRISMVNGKGRAVHVCGDQGVCVESLFNRNAADEWRHLAWNRIEPAKLHVLSGIFYSGFFEERFQAWTGKLGVAHGSLSPLDPRNLRALQGTAVSGALKSVGNRMDGNLREIGEREPDSFLHFAVNR